LHDILLLEASKDNTDLANAHASMVVRQLHRRQKQSLPLEVCHLGLAKSAPINLDGGRQEDVLLLVLARPVIHELRTARFMINLDKRVVKYRMAFSGNA
jgi:hypothetical protein